MTQAIIQTLTVIQPGEIATQLKKSLSWVYANAPALGASRIGGSWIFSEEGLQDALQAGQEVARASHGVRADKNERRVHHKERRPRVGAETKKTLGERARRHNLNVVMR